MSAEIWPGGYGRRCLDSVDSTMAEAARSVSSLAGPEWILARHQSAARGRRGRLWKMPPGNFAATLLLPVAGGPAQAALRSFVASLALLDAFGSCAGTTGPFALKWPNDVLLNGGKVAGILLESLPDGWLSIGFGVNLIAAPDPGEVETGALRPVSLSGELGCAITPDRLLDALAPAYAAWEKRFRDDGFAPIRTAWLDRAARLGQPIVARTGSRSLSGIFETVDDQGHLVLSMPDGRHAIPAAEVHFQETFHAPLH